jgi:hypothetical protein
MSTSDRQAQAVSGDQQDAVGESNAGGASDLSEFLVALKGLEAELSKAVDTGDLAGESATDAHYHLQKALHHATQPQPHKAGIKSHLNQLEHVVAEFAELAGATSAVIDVIDILL